MKRKLLGARFGGLTVVAYDGKYRICACDCNCGTVVRVHVANLKQQISCGCAIIQHGEAVRGKTSPEYRIWSGAKSRCTNPQSTNFYRYGGRGITMCPEWSISIEAFIRDVGRRPSRAYTLERIDNDGDYEPGNCRWATRQEQARNTARTRHVTFQGITRCMKDWSTVTGINYRTLRQRFTYGWTVERALTTPTQPRAC